MVDYKKKGVVFGSQAIAKGIERLAIEVDRMMARTGAPHTRPSTYINLGGGLALAFGPDYVRTGPTVKEVGEIAGFHMVNKVWDYLEEYMAPAPAAGVRVAARYAGYTPTYMAAESPGGAPEFYPPLYGQNVSREPVLRDHVRYSLTK